LRQRRAGEGGGARRQDSRARLQKSAARGFDACGRSRSVGIHRAVVGVITHPRSPPRLIAAVIPVNPAIIFRPHAVG
jgi:hypothetical protein